MIVGVASRDKIELLVTFECISSLGLILAMENAGIYSGQSISSLSSVRVAENTHEVRKNSLVVPICAVISRAKRIGARIG